MKKKKIHYGSPHNYTACGFWANHPLDPKPITYNKRTIIAMHRLILNTPQGMEVDHKDFNGLNNQRNNIRNCTRAQNQQHRRKKENMTSKYMGVSWNKKEKCWYAQVRRNGKTEVLARTVNEVEAAKAYDKRARELYGEFASTNF